MSGSGNVSAARIRTGKAMGNAGAARTAVKSSAPMKNNFAGKTPDQIWREGQDKVAEIEARIDGINDKLLDYERRADEMDTRLMKRVNNKTREGVSSGVKAARLRKRFGARTEKRIFDMMDQMKALNKEKKRVQKEYADAERRAKGLIK